MNRGPSQAARARLVVFGCAAATTVAKLRLAATTVGTGDVGRFREFAASVHKLGPIGIYNTHFKLPYNHPPLVGWFLVAVNAISRSGPSFRFLLRTPASVSDLVTALLVFEIVRLRRSVPEAMVAGLVVALSPVLVIVSGFHGNTDPVFVMFILLSAYLVIKDRPVLSGASAAVAISIKLVPVVALPVIVAALVRDRRRLGLAVAGFLVVFVPLWAPVVVRQWTGFKRNVLDYEGVTLGTGRWGIVDLVRVHDARLLDALVGPGRFIVLAISAFVPAFLVLRNRGAVATGVAASLALFLLLSTAFATQYMSWAAAAVVLLDLWAGIAYNVAAGVLLLVVYTHWTNGFPWNEADARALTSGQARLGWLVWGVLLTGVVLGIRRLWNSPDAPDLVIDLDEPPRPQRRPRLQSITE